MSYLLIASGATFAMAIRKFVFSRFFAVGALCACTIAFASFSVRAQDVSPTSQALILFDASGSMWGKIEGGAQAKFESSAAALNGALAAQKIGALPAGLIVFGGRCSSAPLTVSAQAGSAAQIRDVVTRLNPKGKGPISLALETAADTLPSGGKSSVVVIHDGPDNCRRDPCEAAKAFAARHPGVRVHLVSIGLPKPARIATACVAKLTGGSVAQVETLDQLNSAINKAVTLAMRAPAKGRQDETTAQTQEDGDDVEPAPSKTGPPRLRLAASLGSNGKILKTPVRWRIFEGAKADAAPFIDISESRLAMPLKPGTYTVVASIGLLEQRHKVTIASQGASVLKVAFDAGRVLLRDGARNDASTASSAPGGADSIVTLARVSSGARSAEDGTGGMDAASAVIVVAAGGSSDVILPSGSYRLITQKGRVRAEQIIKVAAGKRLAVDVAPGTGELKLELATSVDAVDQDGILYKISVDDPEAQSGRREIVRSSAKLPSFTLAAGTYYVSARAGFATSKTRVAVSANASTTAKLDLPAALLNLKTNLVISGQPSNLPVQYRIINIGKGGRQIALSRRRNPAFILRPGKYRIVAEIGARNVTAKTEVDLPDGSKTQVTLNPRAGAVELKLGGNSSAATVNRFWVVRDQSGMVVWRSNAYAPSALLAPGVYEVTCETRNGELKMAFELASGESKSVELSSQ